MSQSATSQVVEPNGNRLYGRPCLANENAMLKVKRERTDSLKQMLTPAPGAQKKPNVNSTTTTLRSKEKSNPRRWTKAEDDALRFAVEQSGEKNWKAIAEQVPGRNHTQCLQRWTKVLKPGLIKGHWTGKEDAKLRCLVKEGKKNWGQVAMQIPGRTSKQCRERWCNHLDPNINKGSYTEEEDKLILDMQEKLGNRWSLISQQLKGRTEDAVKIRWKSLMRTKRAKEKDDKKGIVGGRINNSVNTIQNNLNVKLQSNKTNSTPPTLSCAKFSASTSLGDKIDSKSTSFNVGTSGTYNDAAAYHHHMQQQQANMIYGSTAPAPTLLPEKKSHSSLIYKSNAVAASGGFQFYPCGVQRPISNPSLSVASTCATNITNTTTTTPQGNMNITNYYQHHPHSQQQGFPVRYPQFNAKATLSSAPRSRPLTLNNVASSSYPGPLNTYPHYPQQQHPYYNNSQFQYKNSNPINPSIPSNPSRPHQSNCSNGQSRPMVPESYSQSTSANANIHNVKRSASVPSNKFTNTKAVNPLYTPREEWGTSTTGAENTLSENMNTTIGRSSSLGVKNSETSINSGGLFLKLHPSSTLKNKELLEREKRCLVLKEFEIEKIKQELNMEANSTNQTLQKKSDLPLDQQPQTAKKRKNKKKNDAELQQENINSAVASGPLRAVVQAELCLVPAPSPGQMMVTKELQDAHARQERQSILENGWKQAAAAVEQKKKKKFKQKKKTKKDTEVDEDEDEIDYYPDDVAPPSNFEDEKRFDGFLEKLNLSPLDPSDGQYIGKLLGTDVTTDRDSLTLECTSSPQID